MFGKPAREKRQSCQLDFSLSNRNKEWREWLAVVSKYFSRTDGEICPVIVNKANDNRSYIRISVLDNQYVGLLDSGANRTVINREFAEILTSIGLRGTRIKRFQVATADGAAHDITEIFDMPVMLDDQLEVIPAIVMPKLNQQLILGKDFFDVFGISLKFKHHVSDPIQINQLTVKEPVIWSRDELTTEQNNHLTELIDKMRSTVGNGLGRTHILKHHIDTGENKAVHQKQYNYSPVVKAEISKELDKMLRDDVVEPSHSAWCSPVLLVKKPNGDNRLCLDSRQLNRVTKRDTYPLPRVSTVIDNLRNAKFLTTIDLNSAFWQIPLEDNSKEKTAFAVPGRGLFHFKVMPFGLVNASQTQQRLMDILFHSDEDKVWAYLDDIVICSSTWEEHVTLIEKVMNILHSAKLTINVDKCQFARASLKYLGYVIDKKGLRTDPEKVAAIINFPRPRNYTELKRFIGLASWYRRFVENFSIVAAPLHDLTKGKKNKRLVWTSEAESAFVKLKTLLTSTPVVTCPDYSKPFIIQCDASNHGIGAVLCQQSEEGEQPIAYLSRKLNERERKYSTSERELLSIVYAIEKFRPYIDGAHFTVVTDHSALQWLHKMKDPHGRLARWAMKLQQFSYDIVHRPGKVHTVPDALSRGIENDPYTEIFAIDILERHKDEWYRGKVQEVLKQEKPSEWMVSNNLLYKRVFLSQFPNSENNWKLYVPEAVRSKVLKECHDDITAGHLGIRKTYFKIKLKYFWPNLLQEVKQYVRQCETCAKHKVLQQVPAGLMGQHREVQRPWQIISLDLMGPFPKSKNCNTMLLVITCWFSKFVLLFPLRTGKADKICDTLEKQFLLFGSPQAIICDNGKQFSSQLFKDTAAKYNSKLWFTPSYHPQSNPTERVNRVIGTMIATYTKPGKHNTWDTHLPEIGHAIRTAVHETTGYTPSYLFLGRETTVPNLSRPGLDQTLLGPNDTYQVNVTEYVKQIECRNDNYNKVQSRLRAAHAQSSQYYNSKRRSSYKFNVGDTVWKRTKLLSNASNKFMAKLAPKYEKAIIIDKVSNNVFRLNNAFGKLIGNWHVKDLKPLS